MARGVRGRGLFTALPSVSNYFCASESARPDVLAVAGAEPSRGLNRKMQRLSEVSSHSQFSVRQPPVQCVPIESHNS